MPDDKSAMAALEKNAIFIDRIQAETIRKELRVHRLYENYMMSPAIKNNLVITNTPQRMNMNSKDEIEDEEYIKFAREAALKPRERYPFPLKSSHEIGWQTEPLMRNTDPRFYHPRTGCEITRMYGQASKMR